MLAAISTVNTPLEHKGHGPLLVINQNQVHSVLGSLHHGHVLGHRLQAGQGPLQILVSSGPLSGYMWLSCYKPLFGYKLLSVYMLLSRYKP